MAGHLILWAFIFVVLSGTGLIVATEKKTLYTVCAPGIRHNDLVYLLQGTFVKCDFPTFGEAVSAVAENASIHVLYDNRPQELRYEHLTIAADKDLRVFAEYVFFENETSEVYTTKLERAVVPDSKSEFDNIAPLRILNMHVVNHTLIRVDPDDVSHLVMAKVAGYDYAAYGLPSNASEIFPLLVSKAKYPLMIASAPLSDFVTDRYAPQAAWKDVWALVLKFLRIEDLDLRWSPAVRPTYKHNESLPNDAEYQSFVRGVNWYLQGPLLPGPSLTMKLAKMRASQSDGNLDPQFLNDEKNEGGGSGIVGILEGYNSDIQKGGRQLVSCNIRDDCTTEAAMSFAMRSVVSSLDRDSVADYARIARNLLNYVWTRGGYVRAFMPGIEDPLGDSWGLLAWSTSKAAAELFYTDDDARALLAGLATRSLLGDVRWDSTLAGGILGNLRMAGVNGFSSASNSFATVEQSTWQAIHATNYTSNPNSYSPHYQSYIWAVFLRAFDLTGYRPFYTLAYAAISTMMHSFPTKWVPTANGITMQRARMILPLSWLVRVNDTSLHREWLDTIVNGLLARQHPTIGAIREEIEAPGWAGSARVPSNDDYGSFEAPLNQNNSDPVSDLLYTSNFAFLGLHEAYAATGKYKKSVDRLADFLVRVQACSTCTSDDRSRPASWLHPELDGGYFRAFDFAKWEAWASDADLGWGAWSMETGWTQSWITSTFGLRLQNTSLWDLSRGSDDAPPSALRDEILQLVPFYFP